jgi:hypothetical protein
MMAAFRRNVEESPLLLPLPSLLAVGPPRVAPPQVA